MESLTKRLSGTEGMDDEDFRQTLEVFAECALQHSASKLIIDVREFRHRPSAEILAWRDEVTVPKYNRARTEAGVDLAGGRLEHETVRVRFDRSAYKDGRHDRPRSLLGPGTAGWSS